MRIIIVSGLSGSGKTIALQTLEDLNFYCVDNLPVTLLLPFAESLQQRQAATGPQPVAVGVDARNFPDELVRFPELLHTLRQSGFSVEVLFLQASDEVLIKRYSETRRRHPLSQDGSPLADALAVERRLLDPVLGHADLVIDTTHSNVHELRDMVRARLDDTPAGALSILFESFGYKHGVPADADFVFDARCLPNPHWEPHLRALSGLDAEVAGYLAAQADVKAMRDDLLEFLARWIPRFERGMRSYLTVAIGCTGGQHRSVYLAEALGRHFAARRRHVLVRHRELARR